jgi:putative selenate reductase
MSDKMTPLSTNQLLHWIVNEYESTRSIFGIKESNFFRPSAMNEFKMFGADLDTLVGPAAGPHTQMAQNIIASYLSGGRFIELKTVQILDELEIDKPCIDATDECYNIEWSQELRLNQSYEEYVKAWIVIHFLKRWLDLSNSEDAGFIFNMSVGYDLNGIKSEPIDKFINNLIDARGNYIFTETIDLLKGFLSSNKILKIKSIIDHFKNGEIINNISPLISNSITLSTMHGCPPDEIEAIATYLIKEKRLNTYVKLNPTLLGSEFVNGTLAELGYDYLSVNETAFKKDLKMQDAIPMIKRLQDLAGKNEVEFGVKLSNTLQVDNERANLKADEMYMSGRSLFPFTINLAQQLVKNLDENLNISYSGGASAENIHQLIQIGIKPVTVATDLLKPGGYGRLKQMAENSLAKKVYNKIDSELLNEIAKDSLTNRNYQKEKREITSIKVNSDLPIFDCYIAPCKEACPINQDVPEYINLVKGGYYKEAMDVITSKNPLPHITGYICDHQCMNHCTRWDYDEPVLIRDLKKEAAIKGFENFSKYYQYPNQVKENAIKAAIIGAGPAGLASAYFLSRAGVDVTVFEKEMNAGGIVKNVIPHFRLPAEAIEKDIRFIENHGVRFVFGYDYNFNLENLKEESYKYVVIAIGAGVSNTIHLNEANLNVLDAIDFLWEFHHKSDLNIGKNVAVIGGGNSAMDGARAAFRCDGVENVYLIYRRTIEFMPADMEEFYATLEDGVQYKELLQPVDFENGLLKCQKMKLGDYDSDGRRKVVVVEGEFIELEVDTVISAIGEHADFELLLNNKIKIDSNKTYKHSETFETNLKNIFVCGDASSGPATVVEAIADARKVSDEIISREKLQVHKVKSNSEVDLNELNNKKSLVTVKQSPDMIAEANRCLMCSYECNKCVDVCPNRANVAVRINNSALKNSHQILHIDSLCNECGNCETFCPHKGKPYKNKITYYSNKSDIGTNIGFFINQEGKVELVNYDKISINGTESSKLPNIIVNELIKSLPF